MLYQLQSTTLCIPSFFFFLFFFGKYLTNSEGIWWFIKIVPKHLWYKELSIYTATQRKSISTTTYRASRDSGVVMSWRHQKWQSVTVSVRKKVLHAVTLARRLPCRVLHMPHVGDDVVGVRVHDRWCHCVMCILQCRPDCRAPLAGYRVNNRAVVDVDECPSQKSSKRQLIPPELSDVCTRYQPKVLRGTEHSHSTLVRAAVSPASWVDHLAVNAVGSSLQHRRASSTYCNVHTSEASTWI